MLSSTPNNPLKHHQFDENKVNSVRLSHRYCSIKYCFEALTMEMRTHLNIPCKNGCKSDGSRRGTGLDLLCDEPRATDSVGCRTVSALSMDIPAYVATTIYFRKAERVDRNELTDQLVHVASSLSITCFTPQHSADWC